MKISIISTVYNKAPFLNEHIESLLSQTYPEIQFIFVNDGSTDQSLTILKRYEKKDKRIKVIDQKNQGPSIARKNGFLASDGELIYFVDSDDTLYDTFSIEKVVTVFTNNPHIDFVMFQMLNDYDSKQIVDTIIYEGKSSEGTYKTEYLKTRVFRGSMCYRVIKRDVVNTDYFQPYRNFEDVYFTYRLYENTSMFYYSKDILYVVNRKSKNNMRITANLNIDQINTKYLIIERLYEETPTLRESLRKLYVKSYLDDLNYSLKLEKIEKAILLDYLHKNIDDSKLSREYIISKHYKKIYNLRNKLKNFRYNVKISNRQKKINKLKKNIRSMLRR